ncbi:MAG: hypothetical protein J0L88_06355 [Xanthomonadales bacterium]|nr:hypothetical protein [Xanthomonadales bacterium]
MTGTPSDRPLDRSRERRDSVDERSVFPGRVAWALPTYGLVAIVVIAFLGAIAGIGFVTLDDRWYASWVWSHSWMESAYALAAEHGRLLKLSSYTFFAPYLVDKVAYRVALHLGTILVTAWIAGVVLQRIVRLRRVTALFVLLFFAFAGNSYEHNLFVAYPFAWEFSWATWLLGVLGLIIAIERQAMGPALVGMLVWLIGLQEGFVPHTALLVLVTWAMSSEGRRNWRYLVPFLIAQVTWLALWIAWRIAHPSGYAGTDVALDAPLPMVHALVRFSVGGMPLATLWQGADLSMAWRMNGETATLAIVKTVAVFLAAWRIVPNVSQASMGLRPRHLGWIAVTLIGVAFLPNALVALTPKYQQWAEFGVHAYLYSHFSYFAWVGLATLVAVIVHRAWPSTLFSAVIGAVIAAVSLVTDMANARFNLEQREYARRWDTMESMMQSEAFRALPDGAVVYMADFGITYSARGDAEYWTAVARARTAKRVEFTSDPSVLKSAPAGATFFAYLHDEPRSSNQYAVLAPIEIVGEHMIARRMLVYPNTLNDRLTASGMLACAGQPCVEGATVNGVAGDALFAMQFSASGRAVPDGAGTPVMTLEVAGGIDASSLRVDFARNQQRAAPIVELVAARGFEGWSDNIDSSWNWTANQAQLEIRNGTDRVLSLEAGLWFAGASRTIEVSDRGATLARIALDAARPGSLRFRIDAAPGVTMLDLTGLEPVPDGTPPSQVYRVSDFSLSLSASHSREADPATPFRERILGFDGGEGADDAIEAKKSRLGVEPAGR